MTLRAIVSSMERKFSVASIVATAISLPLCLFVGKTLELMLKSINPSNVNIEAPLAYLGTVITSGLICLAVCWLSALGLAIVAYKKHEDTALARTALICIVVVVGLSLGAAVASQKTSALIERTKLLQKE